VTSACVSLKTKSYMKKISIYLILLSFLSVAATAQPVLFTSKYDFVPGDRIVLLEDFSRVAIGDFPAGWNTNASAEVVTVAGRQGKWLKIATRGIFYPEMIREIPENMTLEFYLITGSNEHPAPFAVNFPSLEKPGDFKLFDAQSPDPRGGRHVVQLKLWPGDKVLNKAFTEMIAGSTKKYDIQNKISFTTWHNVSNTMAHVALWRQGTRLRVYVNGEKVWDLPRAFDAATKYNAITFAMPRSFKGDEFYLLGNIRMAVGAPGTRKKLLTDGKFVTHGILFDSGSDQIKPESFGVLKEISNSFTDEPSLKLKIVGHTDAEGDDKSNLLLSQKRAVAVKEALVKNFGISADRISTDGKGESEPEQKGDTPEANATNRRVVFIKM
jgi:outer membrane protein OmpA-like peptidoglycan-associated protein